MSPFCRSTGSRRLWARLSALASRSGLARSRTCPPLGRINIRHRERNAGRVNPDAPLRHDARENGLAAAARMANHARSFRIHDEVMRNAGQAEIIRKLGGKVNVAR